MSENSSADLLFWLSLAEKQRRSVGTRIALSWVEVSMIDRAQLAQELLDVEKSADVLSENTHWRRKSLQHLLASCDAMSNQRDTLRVPCTAGVMFQLADGSVQRGIIFNASLSGMRLMGNVEQLNTSSLIRIEKLYVLQHEYPMCIDAQVVWIRDNEAGLRFHTFTLGWEQKFLAWFQPLYIQYLQHVQKISA